MCRSMILVTNPTRRYEDGKSRPLLWVPCGTCKECRKALQDEWFVRGYLEWLRCKNACGAAWLLLLTYSNSYLPFNNDEEYGINYACFNHDHLRSFMRLLRYYLKKKGYKAKEIRYFIGCEFGGKRGRPHYHVILFVPFYVSAKDMQECCSKAWKCGFTSWSKKHGMMIESPLGLQYAMKYVSKDMYWFTRPIYKVYADRKIKTTISEYGKELRALYFNQKNSELMKNTPDTDIEKRYKNYRKSCPRHYSSTHFGEEGINLFKNPDGTWNLEKLTEGKIDLKKLGFVTNKPNGRTEFPLPRYFARKIFYERDTWNLYKRTPLAATVLTMRYNMTIQRAMEEYIDICDKSKLFEKLHPFFTSLQLSPILESDIVERINTWYWNSGLSLRDIATYSIVYRGIPLLEAEQMYLDNLQPKQCLMYLNQHALQFMIDCAMINRDPDPESYVKNHPNEKLRKTYSDLPCYAGIEFFLDIMQQANKYYAQCDTKEFDEDHIKSHDLVDFNFHQIYTNIGCDDFFV